jgi:GMP synthase (glutamine-hydrolysing)
MKTAVVIRHVPFEDLGNLEPILGTHGYRIEYREAGRNLLRDIDRGADLLVVLGGPIGAYEEESYPFIKDEISLIEKRLKEDRPTLGICLGAQLMARALGARVYPGPEKEIGWKVLTLTQAAATSSLMHLDGVHVLHWHGDTFDLPQGALQLAATAAYANQAFSWGKCGLALQFHPEVHRSALERWYIGHACEIAGTKGVSVASLRADAAKFAPPLQPRAVRLWESWLSSVG